MIREFNIDKIRIEDRQTGQFVIYFTSTCDGLQPEIRLNFTFGKDVPTEYKTAIGESKNDTFRIEISPNQKQSKLTD